MTRNTAVLKFLRGIGSKGGAKRARTLTPEQRTEIARMGGVARWKKAKGKKR